MRELVEVHGFHVTSDECLTYLESWNSHTHCVVAVPVFMTLNQPKDTSLCGTMYFLITEEYEAVSKSFRTESITKYRLKRFFITRWEATQRIMATKLTILTHKIATQLHLAAQSCSICISRSRWSVRKRLDTPHM